MTTHIPALAPHVRVRDDAETPTLSNTTTGQLFVLNSVSKRIIELCDGRSDIEAIADRICEEFAEVDQARAVADTEKFLQAAATKGVVEWRQTL